MTRRDFVKLSAAAGAAAALPRAFAAKPKEMRAVLLHLGHNMWCDWFPKEQMPRMRELYPNDEERLRHIFEKQVYGLAPTKIIYAIATHFILGFSDEIPVSGEHFKYSDALPAAKAGTLKHELDELFGGDEE